MRHAIRFASALKSVQYGFFFFLIRAAAVKGDLKIAGSVRVNSAYIIRVTFK